MSGNYHRVLAFGVISETLMNTAELTLNFLYRCRNEDVHPKFTCWKNLKTKDKTKRRNYRRIFLDEINHKISLVKQLKINTISAEHNLSQIPWLKRFIIKHAISNYIKREDKKIELHHRKKFQQLLIEKHHHNGTEPNPNKLIFNLTDVELTKDQYSALQFGLKHGIAIAPRESDLFASAESMWEQLTRNNLLKNNFHSIERAKNAINALTFTILDFDHKCISKDYKHIKIIKKLQTTTTILKPDKGGVVLITKDDYMKSMNSLFSDRRKFKTINNDPTHRRLTAIQRYLRSLVKRGELSKDTYKKIRPRNARPARAHGLPKIHKPFDRLPKFRPIIDTTGTTHYSVGKYISELLQPLTQNEFNIKDTFNAANRIKSIPPDLFTQGYKFVSLDVESLFTNVPLQRTLNIILDRIFDKKLINTDLKKSTLRKVILDTCTKTVFSCNNK